MKSKKKVINFLDMLDWEIDEKDYQLNKHISVLVLADEDTLYRKTFSKLSNSCFEYTPLSIKTREFSIEDKKNFKVLEDTIKIRFFLNLKINNKNYERLQDTFNLLSSEKFKSVSNIVIAKILHRISMYPNDFSIAITSEEDNLQDLFTDAFDYFAYNNFENSKMDAINFVDVVWPRPSMSIDFSDSVFLILLNVICVVIPLLIGVAYFTLAERKIMASIQRRRGPNVIGYIGLFQPLADGLKLFLKETILPTNANLILFIIAPIITFVLSLISWAVIPFGQGQVIADLQLGILYSLAISSLGVYGVLISGWSSNSKYAFLGGLRSAAQMVSYEIPMGFIIVIVVLCVGSANLSEIVLSQKDVWLMFPLLPLSCIFFVCCLAETNRHPFDLPEAEAELVSGYNVEYSAMGFALFFLGEYANMLLMSAITSILFLGGWLPFWGLEFLPSSLCLGLKVCLFVILFIWIRAILPRYRYDQLMKLGWKCFLPLTLAFLFFISGILVSFNWLPN